MQAEFEYNHELDKPPRRGCGAPEMAGFDTLEARSRLGMGMETTSSERPKLDAQQVTVNSVGSSSSSSQQQGASVHDDLRMVGITDLLDLDDRPTFILDLLDCTAAAPVYYNDSLRNLQVDGLDLGIRILETFSNGSTDLDASAFVEWANSSQRERGQSFTNYCAVQWSAKTLRKRWRLVTGTTESHSSAARSVSPPPPEIGRLSRQSTAPVQTQNGSISGPPTRDDIEKQFAAFRLHREDRIPTFPSVGGENTPARVKSEVKLESLGAFDLTTLGSSIPASSHLEFFLGFDWAATELGPISSWCHDLRRMCNFLLTDARPASMYWGKQRTTMYNEAYAVVTGQKHPGMMGKTFSEAWGEVEGDFAPAFKQVSETGQAWKRNDACFYLDIRGYLEETYFSISILPFNVDGGDVAFYNPVFDTTRQVIADRRMVFLLRLGQFIAVAKESKDFWRELLRGLDVQNPDLPFALLYSVGGGISEKFSNTSEQSSNARSWTLEGSVSVPASCIGSYARFRSDTAVEAFVPNFTELIKSETPTLLRSEDGTLPSLISKEIPVMDGTEFCEAAILLPIRSGGGNVLGFLVLGVNPRKRFDDDYNIFIELLSRQLATSLASALLLEEEVRRGKLVAEQADRDRNLLSRKLAIQTHEATEIENRFRRMADLAPVGMFHIDPAGVLLYANDDYYSLTEHPRNVSYPMSWYNVLLKEDHELMDVEWAKLLQGEVVNFEIRLKRPFFAEEIAGGEKLKGHAWILAAAYAEKAADGTVVGILGCITDISRQKWAEDFQNRKMLEAIELKRQQENFIDMTSHEMRNPLSAIIQCADWIASSIPEFDNGTKDVTLPAEIMDSYSDAAQTIVLCAQHQTRIIDDILTLSKLDSDLLVITPVEVQPITVVKTGLKMFSGELQKSDIDFKFIVDKSYQDLAVDWVKLDPSRLLQVLINLMTNAIKFTQCEARRRISISVSASLDHPQVRNGVEYLPRGTDRRDFSAGAGWGSGESIYLYLEVQDSGRGLNELERNLLFKRFSQASPRTHVQYGGSGLGLFISRELAELQGGQIGVCSEAGVGSTFAFFVRARRCQPPEGPRSTAPTQADLQAQTKILSGGALSTIQSGPLPSRRSSKHLPELRTPPRHVLVVEDNIVNQKVLRKQLQSAGCVVSVANHGREALEFLERSQFWIGKESSGRQLSVVLMDMEMPVMDGLTCVKMIRKFQDEGKITGHVPVIAVTANARSEQITMAKEAGMDSVVTKPFRIPELLPEIERQLNKGTAAKRATVERSVSDPSPL